MQAGFVAVSVGEVVGLPEGEAEIVTGGRGGGTGG